MATTNRSSAAGSKKGFPVQQLFILALCRICEPISFTSIFPYIYQMIDSFGIAKSTNEIGIYAGMVTSAFALAEFSTGMIWGRISDSHGRKPVLIIGLIGTLISMLIFGFSKSFAVCLIARALGGGLNGNIGVIQTTVAELVREKEHQPRAFAIMPFVWCLGSIVGPSLGGLLAEPTRFYPHIFPPGGLLEKYPFLLPNMVASILLVFGIANGILFLEETHDVLKHKRDRGLEAGQRFLRVLGVKKDPPLKDEYPNGFDSLPPQYESEPLLGAQDANVTTYSSVEINMEDEEPMVKKKPPPVNKTFTRPVVGLIISYGILAYHSMGYEQLMPVFLSTPPETNPSHSWISFSGGLGMNTQTIGFILSLQGVFSMLAQFFVFPSMVRIFGTLNVYRSCMFTYPVSYMMVPYLDFLPANLQLTGIYVTLAIKIIYGVLAYPCNAILLTNSAPSLLVLGAINGIAASCASLARAFSPTITGMIYSKGLNINMVGLAWWVNAGVCVLGGVQCLMMKHEDFEGHHDEELDGQMDEEAVEHIAVQAQVAHESGPVGTAEGVVNEYGLVIQAVENEFASLYTNFRSNRVGSESVRNGNH